MTDEAEVRYFALLNRAGDPAGLLRRAKGRRDESLRRDLSWQPSEFLRRYELGRNEYDYKEITSDEAERLIEHWRVKWAQE